MLWFKQYNIPSHPLRILQQEISAYCTILARFIAPKHCDIRLVRSKWLLAQPTDFRMVWRQKLEELDSKYNSVLDKLKDLESMMSRTVVPVGA